MNDLLKIRTSEFTKPEIVSEFARNTPLLDALLAINKTLAGVGEVILTVTKMHLVNNEKAKNGCDYIMVLAKEDDGWPILTLTYRAVAGSKVVRGQREFYTRIVLERCRYRHGIPVNMTGYFRNEDGSGGIQSANIKGFKALVDSPHKIHKAFSSSLFDLVKGSGVNWTSDVSQCLYNPALGRLATDKFKQAQNRMTISGVDIVYAMKLAFGELSLDTIPSSVRANLQTMRDTYIDEYEKGLTDYIASVENTLAGEKFIAYYIPSYGVMVGRIDGDTLVEAVVNNPSMYREGSVNITQIVEDAVIESPKLYTYDGIPRSFSLGSPCFVLSSRTILNRHASIRRTRMRTGTSCSPLYTRLR